MSINSEVLSAAGRGSGTAPLTATNLKEEPIASGRHRRQPIVEDP
jgi:hypothetical protein